jgi:hypothetical protein
MTEELIFIESGGLKLEGLLDNTSDQRGVVVTHPHPLYLGQIDDLQKIINDFIRLNED